MKLFLFSCVVRGFPAFLLGTASYAAAGWIVKRGGQKLVKIVMLILTLGMIYGLLRYAGVIRFAADPEWISSAQALWFDRYYQKDGFPWACYCGACLLGVASGAAGSTKRSRDAAEEE